MSGSRRQAPRAYSRVETDAEVIARLGPDRPETDTEFRDRMRRTIVEQLGTGPAAWLETLRALLVRLPRATGQELDGLGEELQAIGPLSLISWRRQRVKLDLATVERRIDWVYP